MTLSLASSRCRFCFIRSVDLCTSRLLLSFLLDAVTIPGCFMTTRRGLARVPLLLLQLAYSMSSCFNFGRVSEHRRIE